MYVHCCNCNVKDKASFMYYVDAKKPEFYPGFVRKRVWLCRTCYERMCHREQGTIGEVVKSVP